MDFLRRLFDPSGFPARWFCGSGWSESPWLGWLHILSDLGVWTAYLAIPLVLIFFMQRRHDLPFRRVFLLFGAFIFACGTTHLMEAVIFWWPVYRLSGIIKLITAVVSWGTVFALIQVIPNALAMRSPEELQREIQAREEAERALNTVNADLEHRILKRTEELTHTTDALRDERELLQTTLRSIGDGVIITDPDGRVTFLNAVAEQLTGWTNAEAQGAELNRVFELLDEESRLPLENPVFNALRDGTITGLSGHSILRSRNGRERPIDDSAAPIRGDSSIVRGAVLVFRDITNRRAKDLEISRTLNMLKRSNADLEHFAFIASHDLQSPLRAIGSLADWIAEDAAATLTPEAREHLSLLRGRASRMKRMLDDLLEYSRIGQIEKQIQEIDLAELIADILELQPPPPQFRVILPEQTLKFSTYRIGLQMCLRNLIGNAIKHHHNPGQGQVRISAELSDNRVTIEVSDNGPGIPQKYQEKVFEMFQTLRPRDEIEGSGMGLAIVKNAAEHCGGSVMLLPETEEGCTFRLQFPIWNTPST